MKHKAILELYPNIKSIIEDGDNWKYFDDNGAEIEVSVNWSDVDAKVSELETAEASAITEQENLKASAKAKLIAGEALTEEEANTIVL
jgi:hypothetical protein